MSKLKAWTRAAWPYVTSKKARKIESAVIAWAIVELTRRGYIPA